MATTRIMPLHVGKGRTESRAISDIIDYVANPKKTDNGRLITGYACDSRTADAEFLLAKRQYIAATGRVRGTDDVIAYHVRQSFRPGEITQEEANRLGVEFAKRFTKGNHAFVVCTHIDKYRSHRIVSPYRSINHQLQKSEAFQSVHHVTFILCYNVLSVFSWFPLPLRSVQSGYPPDVLHPCICPYQSS